MKAKSVTICIFTNLPPNTGGGAYAPESLPQPERGMYAATSAAATELFQQEGLEGTVLGMCNAQAAEFAQFIASQTATPPYIAIAGTFPDGSQRAYILKSATGVKNYIRAMWSGEFGGTGVPVNLGEGTGGYGSGSNILCQIFPPLCTLGFWPWLALVAFTTYRTAEARSIVGRGLWGAAAFFTWKEFLDRGGLQQLGKMVGIGSIKPYFKHNGKELEILHTIRYDTGKRPNLEKQMRDKGVIATHWLTTKQSGTPKYIINEFENGEFGKIRTWK